MLPSPTRRKRKAREDTAIGSGPNTDETEKRQKSASHAGIVLVGSLAALQPYGCCSSLYPREVLFERGFRLIAPRLFAPSSSTIEPTVKKRKLKLSERLIVSLFV